MNGNERREKLLNILKNSDVPVSGRKLAEQFGVSRQVVVQDMALLRADHKEIVSTTSGYLIPKSDKISRVFKVKHTDEQVEDELKLITELGGTVKDVFIYHKVYDTVRADLNIENEKDIEEYLEDIKTGKSGLLMNITSGYHYHTVYAPTEKLLDLIQEELQKRGYLAQLMDYEPVNFWKEEASNSEN